MTQFSLLLSWKSLQNPPQDLELHQHPLQEWVVLFHPQIAWAGLHSVSLKGSDDLRQRGLRPRVGFLHLLCLSMDLMVKVSVASDAWTSGWLKWTTVPWFVTTFTSWIWDDFTSNFFKEYRRFLLSAVAVLWTFFLRAIPFSSMSTCACHFSWFWIFLSSCCSGNGAGGGGMGAGASRGGAQEVLGRPAEIRPTHLGVRGDSWL